MLWSMAILATMLFTGVDALALTRGELKDRFKQRYPALRAAKEAGKVGETYKGFVEAVESDKSVASLVDEENNDRTELYKQLAADEKTTPEKVGEVNGERNFKNAAPGTFLKGRDGAWKKK